MAAIVAETKIFENWDGYSAEIPCGSISHGFRDISIFVFSLFEKFIMINESLITRPFFNQSMPKSNDFQILID